MNECKSSSGLSFTSVNYMEIAVHFTVKTEVY